MAKHFSETTLSECVQKAQTTIENMRTGSSDILSSDAWLDTRLRLQDLFVKYVDQSAMNSNPSNLDAVRRELNGLLLDVIQLVPPRLEKSAEYVQWFTDLAHITDSGSFDEMMQKVESAIEEMSGQ